MLDLGGAKMSGTKASAPAVAGDFVKDATDASFMADVVEASRTQPVIVDFWAPWCGPCRQLTPALEKAVAAANGAVRLVKVNIDENPAVAGQLRVQSIPTVYAFVDGQPVDGFQGAQPDSQVKAFIDRLSGPPEASDLDMLLEMAAESLQLGDMGGAAQGYAQALQMDPTNVKAIAGLARCYLAGGDVERAAEVAAMADPAAKDADLAAVRAAIALAQAGAETGETATLQRRVAADPTDLQAKFDLAGALAADGDFAEAADQLLAVIAVDRDWNGGAAKAQLLTVFEASGPGSDVARTGRRRLSALLFA
jgi:putative thioredoxin